VGRIPVAVDHIPEVGRIPVAVDRSRMAVHQATRVVVERYPQEIRGGPHGSVGRRTARLVVMVD